MAFKGRQPDKPGTYRIRPSKHGGMRLSGVTLAGRRVRMDGLTDAVASDIASKLFPKAEAPKPVVDWNTAATDDWGVPLRVSDETVASVAQTLNIPDPTKPVPPMPVAKLLTPEETEKKERRAKNAKSLMDLAGIAGSAGIVIVSRRITEAADKEPVKPDPKQVGDLRDSIRETLTDIFGESEVAPWQMMILLALGIPISMLLQSPRRKRIEGPTSGSPTATPLKSVP
jgi:hypothetical protein